MGKDPDALTLMPYDFGRRVLIVSIDGGLMGDPDVSLTASQHLSFIHQLCRKKTNRYGSIGSIGSKAFLGRVEHYGSPLCWEGALTFQRVTFCPPDESSSGFKTG